MFSGLYINYLFFESVFLNLLSSYVLWVHDDLANNITTMFSMLGKEGIICVPSNVSSFARAFGQQTCHNVTMVLDSNGPIIFHFTSLYLALKFFSYNMKIKRGKDTYTIQVHEPQAETA